MIEYSQKGGGQLSYQKISDIKTRQLLEITKRSLIKEIYFTASGNTQESDVVGGAMKDILGMTLPARRNDIQLIVISNDQNAVAKGLEDAFLIMTRK